MKLTTNVYVETEFRGATVSYVTTADGIVMIDSPYKPSDAMRWKKEIESSGILRYLTHTESHNDHTVGDFFFAVPIVAQDTVREEILARDINQIVTSLVAMDPESAHLVRNYKFNLPCITFSKQLTLYLGKHSFHLIHLPGHSAGQTAVFVPEERVVFTGDNVFGKVQSFLHTADPFAWLKSLKQLDKLDVAYVVPGHGEVCDKSCIREQASYIQECLDVITKAIKQGLTREETLAKVKLPSRYPLEKGLEQRGQVMVQLSVGRLYDLLSQK